MNILVVVILSTLFVSYCYCPFIDEKVKMFAFFLALCYSLLKKGKGNFCDWDLKFGEIGYYKFKKNLVLEILKNLVYKGLGS